ncbi:MAG: hypothetical protein ACP5HG_17755 [Anaerolineae bacterium]
MPESTGIGDRAVIWQGTQHEWEYNHRLNRLGSYVRYEHTSEGDTTAIIGHTAASGTGDDTAHFSEYVTAVEGGAGIAFQAGYAETVAECPRGDLQPFVIRVPDLDLAPELQERDLYVAIINGFDIYAQQHSEKIMTFDVEITDPIVYNGGQKARFYIVGHLRFDCRSSECQLLPWRLEMERIDQQEELDERHADIERPEPRSKKGIDRRKVDRAARWLKRQLARLTDVEAVKRSVIGEDGDTLRRRLFRILGRRLYVRFLKWRFSAPYVIRIHYLIVAGDRKVLRVTESPDFEREYAWDLEHEIERAEVGSMPVIVQGDDPAVHHVNTLAFKRILMDVTIDEEQGSEDPIQWGKGMHMLEWSFAIRNIQPVDQGVKADLDLFYKNWSEAMNKVITLTTWGAVRAAGRARVGTRLALLQSIEGRQHDQLRLPGKIHWPGRGRSATQDSRARFERRLPDVRAEEI